MRIYTHCREITLFMNTAADSQATPCNCGALREAARHVTQFYDQHLAAAGLRTTQFSILARLKLLGPTTINALAQNLVMDRTTLGRNILPLKRRRLIEVRKGRDDGRIKELRLTKAGLARLAAASEGWAKAQSQFETTLGGDRASELRGLLRAVVGSDLRRDAALSAASD
jgi:DNA-binding MarR family transcriptional regulator